MESIDNNRYPVAFPNDMTKLLPMTITKRAFQECLGPIGEEGMLALEHTTHARFH